jgi:hypothetical protein
MQTEKLVPLNPDADAPDVAELVSVFLGPHEHLVASQEPNLASERKARYDGVIQYGSHLLVVIESKLYANASQQQSQEINTGGVAAKQSKLVHVRWQELLDRWWNLTELEVLGHADKEIISDFFDNAEENFGDLLPYTNLERCGGNEARLLRRLRMILEEAAGSPGRIDRAHGVLEPSGELCMPGVNVQFPEGQVVAIERVAMWADGGNVCLAAWPGEQKPQYERVYSDPKKVEDLIALTGKDGWKLDANFYIGYRNCRPLNRWYPSRHLGGPAYMRQWIDDFDDGWAAARSREKIEDASFRHWLVERDYADDHDLATLDSWLNQWSPNIQFFIRPSARVTRTWPLPDAVSLDGKNKFVGEVRDAVNQVLAALGEEQVLGD